MMDTHSIWSRILLCLVIISSTLLSPVSGQCTGSVQADMVFILDASTSVRYPNFRTMLAFVQDLINDFDIGSDKVRVGVQTYSSSTTTEFNLNDYYDKTTMVAAVGNIRYTRGTTDTGGALEYLRNTMFTSSNGDRPTVTNIGVLLSDGVSNDPSETAIQASNARSAGITLFSIGIGRNIPLTELNEIATDPDSDHVFAVASFSGLDSIRTAFQAQACPSVDGNWGSWASWGSCSVTCGGGTQSRSRNCDNPAASNGGAACSGSGSDSTSCNSQACPVDGNWGSWASWGSCSVTCGGGTQSRSRNCDNPASSNGGAACSGSGSDSTSCNSQACPIDGNWGSWASWGSCSVTCGGGTQSRSRNCDNPASSNGGAACSGSGSDSTSCNSQACPIDGSWGSWASWGSCSVTCGGGTQSRSRNCDNPASSNGGAACSGSGSDSTSCNSQACPIDGNWGSWASWGSCSVTCGGGTQSRSRNCDNPASSNGGAACSGSGSDSTSCNSQACPVDGNWGSWASWGSCSVTCAGGTKSRSRNCDNPAASNGGAACSGSGSDSTSCNSQACPVDGNWGSWASWGSCSVTCAGGTKPRSRNCDNPAASNGGAACSGSGSDSTSCNSQACPIDGSWGSWASWGSCSVTCAGGTKSRSRNCDNPAASNGGAACSGSGSDSTSCNSQACPVDGNWGSWASWGSCSVTCAGGTKSRSRNCDNPAASNGGAACSGSGSDSTSCNSQACPVDGNWGTWASWGSCSVTCAGGTKSRSRNCDNPAASNGGAACSGSGSDSTSCNSQGCAVDGAWSSWQVWSACSVTCKVVGVRVRDRNCDAPAVQNGGADCPGNGNETESCDYTMTLCSPGNGWAPQVYETTSGTPVGGGFNSWGQWSACTRSCRAGVRVRNRQCNSPVPIFGGLECAGDYVQSETCNNVACSVNNSYVQTCSNGYFNCLSNTTACLYYLKWCDCVKDCADGSDESVDYAGCAAEYSACSPSHAGVFFPELLLVGFLALCGTLLPYS